MTDEPEKPRLNVNSSDSTWLAIRRVVNEEIEKRRDELEQLGTTPERTSELRGEIAFARDLIRLVEPPIPEPDNGSYSEPGGIDPPA
jgi:hypothetical protein